MCDDSDKSRLALVLMSHMTTHKRRTRRCCRVPPGARTSTRPATDRSRSNQVCHRPPPYGSTLTDSHALFLVSLDTGFSFRHGLRYGRRMW